MRTYLQLVNAVLVELREDEVTDFSDTYVALVAAYVNKAFRQVAYAHDWSATLTDFSFTTVPSQQKYSLTDAETRGKIDLVVNTDDAAALQATARRWIKERSLFGTTSESTPTKWCHDGVDANGDSQLSLYPVPSGTTNITVTMWLKEEDLDAVTDTTKLPHQPIIDLAVAFAVRERGETGGTSTAEYFELAKRTLSDAIAYDSALNDEEDDWYPV